MHPSFFVLECSYPPSYLVLAEYRDRERLHSALLRHLSRYSSRDLQILIAFHFRRSVLRHRRALFSAKVVDLQIFLQCLFSASLEPLHCYIFTFGFFPLYVLTIVVQRLFFQASQTILSKAKGQMYR